LEQPGLCGFKEQLGNEINTDKPDEMKLMKMRNCQGRTEYTRDNSGEVVSTRAVYDVFYTLNASELSPLLAAGVYFPTRM
jgi:hypothetical protein